MKEFESILIDYFDGSLDKDQHTWVENQLRTDPKWQEEWNRLKQLMASINSVELGEPSPLLSERFYQFLDQQEAQEKTPIPIRSKPTSQRWKVAAAILLLMGGVGLWTMYHQNKTQSALITALQAEMQRTQKMLVLSMLRHDSPAQRLKGVYAAMESPVDSQLVDGLLLTLKNDQNVNVRLQAIEGLTQIAPFPGITENLLTVLKNENSPELQIALIDALVTLRAKEALSVFENLMNQDSLLPLVKDKAAEGVGRLI